MWQIVTLSNELIYSLQITPFTSPYVYSSELNGFIMVNIGSGHRDSA
jgi:hypothetical protein